MKRERGPLFFYNFFSCCFIILVGLISVFAYGFAPDNSQYANQMHLVIHSKKPGFSVTMLTIPSQLESNQRGFDKLFFGNENSATENPISGYKIDNNIYWFWIGNHDNYDKLISSF